MRLFSIARAFSKHRLYVFLPNIWAVKLFRLLFFWQPKTQSSASEALREFLESLGPVYIKLGQLMSVRRDLVGDEIADSLSILQDAVAPMPWHQVNKILNANFTDYQSLFLDIEKSSLAAASIAQVHLATKSNGEQCVVKILRPNLSVVIKKDIRLARKIGKFLELIYPRAKRLRLPELVNDYSHVIHDELDLSKEAASMSQVKRNFAGSLLLYVPAVDWKRSTDSVLTMEKVSGIIADDLPLLNKLQVDRKLLAERGVEIFFTQVFEHNFFHADMHPGNIFVDAQNPKLPRYIAVDFGIMGALCEYDQHFLAISLLAFFNHDYQGLAQSYIDSGWVDESTSAIELEAAFRTVLEPYLGKSIADISLAKILLKLFKVSDRFGMEIQPQLVLLDKTLLYVEGLGRQIYPELDLWKTAKPFIEKWLKKQMGFAGFVQKSKKNLAEFMSALPDTPLQIHRVVSDLQKGRLTINYQNKVIEQSLKAIKKQQKHNQRLIFSGFGLLSAVLLFGQTAYWLAGVILVISSLVALKK